MDNSFITIEQDLIINIPAHDAVGTIQTYYIRYKYSADVIDQYRISSNNDLIQTQNHVRYELFKQYNSVSDEAKEKHWFICYDEENARNETTSSRCIC